MKLLIVGAGGHGKCCAEIAERMNMFEIISFLDDRYLPNNDEKIVGKLQDLDILRKEYNYLFVAIGNNTIRCEIYKKAKSLDYKMVNLIDPSAFVSKRATLGEMVVIFPNAVLEANCDVSTGSIIASNVTINHDSVVGEFVLIYSNTVIRPEAHIGDLCRIDSGCVILFGINMKPKSHILDGSIVEC